MRVKNNGKSPNSAVFDFSPGLFQGAKGARSFKFVYLQTADRLLIGPEDLKHRKIAQEGLSRDFGRNELIGAFISCREKKGLMCFTLYGRSGYFGRPDRTALRQVADHIAARLDSPVITAGNNIKIEGRLPSWSRRA
jgi:hypothetical protein